MRLTLISCDPRRGSAFPPSEGRARRARPQAMAKPPGDDSPSGGPGFGDDGFGLMEVVVAMTILALIFIGIGWVITSSLSASEFAKQRSTAASIIAQTDALIQANVPSKTCAGTAPTYITQRTQGVSISNGSGDQNTVYTVTPTYTTGPTTTPPSSMLAVTIAVAWKSAQPALTGSMSNQILVRCM